MRAPDAPEPPSDAHQPPAPTRSGIEAAFVIPWWRFRRCVHRTAG